MKAFKVNADTVAALISCEELERSGKEKVQSLACEAFSQLGEEISEGVDVTAFKNGGNMLLFAEKKRKKPCFNITEWYPSVM